MRVLADLSVIPLGVGVSLSEYVAACERVLRQAGFDGTQGERPRDEEMERRSGSLWLTPALFRFGASSLANDLVRQVIRQTTGSYAAAYDVSEA